jgi:hypothetical protein
MRIDVQVPVGSDVQIQEPVTAHLVQHVLEEGDTRVESGLSATVQIDADPNPGLQGVPLDRGGAPLGFL